MSGADQHPYLTDALLYGEPSVPRKIVVKERVIGRIGALCYIRRRGKHHEKAAELFKARYEAIYGAGVPAFDNARPAVDTSLRATDGGMAAIATERSGTSASGYRASRFRLMEPRGPSRSSSWIEPARS